MEVVLYLIGLVVIFKAAWAVAKLIWIHTSDPKQLTMRYGEGSWALITGCTEGIGRAFALELAHLKFNLCLVSRNHKKLEAVKKKILDSLEASGCSPVQVEIVVADFNCKESQLYDRVLEAVKDKDLSLVINNVGIAHLCKKHKHLHSQTYEQVEEQLNVNIRSVTYLTHKLLPKLLQRGSGKRCGLINLSSRITSCPFPEVNIYSATKAYDDMFTRCLVNGYSHKLDVLSVKPCLVVTAGTNYTTDLTACSSEQCVRGVLKALGKTTRTEGHWTHTVQSWLLDLVHQKLIIFFGRRQMDRQTLAQKSSK